MLWGGGGGGGGGAHWANKNTIETLTGGGGGGGGGGALIGPTLSGPLNSTYEFWLCVCVPFTMSSFNSHNYPEL